MHMQQRIPRYSTVMPGEVSTMMHSEAESQRPMIHPMEYVLTKLLHLMHSRQYVWSTTA